MQLEQANASRSNGLSLPQFAGQFDAAFRACVESVLPRWGANLVAIFLASVVAVADLLTAPYVLLTGFYLIPLFLAVWFAAAWVVVLVLLLALALTLHSIWLFVPSGTGSWLHMVEYLALAAVFPIVTLLLLFAKSALSAMAQAKQRLETAASVFHTAGEGILITDASGRILEANDNFLSITGYGRHEVIGKTPQLLRSGYQAADFYRKLWDSIRTEGQWSGEIWNRNKSGEVYAEWLTIRAVRDDRGAIANFIGVYSDISPVRERKKELDRIAHYDPLTGLPNRLLLSDRLAQAIDRALIDGGTIALAHIDIDRFGQINDEFGYRAGDTVLCEISQRILACLSGAGELARIGGDEFFVILTNLDHPESCRAALDQLLAAISAPMVVGGAEQSVTASLGVALFPQDGHHPDAMLRNTQHALISAKLAGKNRYSFFNAAQYSSLMARNEQIARLRLAIKRDEFELHYQPKVRMRSGEVIGAEALIRWRHPERGLLAPAAFLNDVESDPTLSDELADWVLVTAIGQLAHWVKSGQGTKLSVNISARQLQPLRLSARLRELLQANAAVRPEWLTLEILETHALDDIERANQAMEECLAVGVLFALDDFGTGYSSLAYLRELKVGQIKIDQAFVRNMLDDAGSLGIVEGVLGLARVFGREVIAEGVETELHGVRLLGLGCEFAQGYGIAKPMSAVEFGVWLGAWEPYPSWTSEAHG